MTWEEYQQALQGVINDLEGGVHADLMVKLANATVATVMKRVRESGIDSQGKPYKDYTPQYKKFKSGLVRRRVYDVSPAGEKTVKKNKKTGKMLKGDFYPNRYKGFTDFDYSSRMWDSTHLQQAESNNNVAVIGARGQDVEGVSNNSKMEWNTNRFGPILEVSEEEKKQIFTDYNNGILQIWRNNGL